ncbi:hypothetical protein HMH01_12465 [Halovulum dunhuangense]|uniref:Prepilin type IV endopeptidase peptidase domain-containing protein n=2 Tax=Halovulum dunhuangense TaxID=1505036 RepID=A0A849L4Y4_9RHOB|nr:hypothetical protein [Halovulum dunhuangense]
MPELAFFLLTLPISFWAAWSDLSRMKISNRLNLILAAVFVVSGIVLLPLGDYGVRLGIGVAALLVGFVLNQAGQVGGGDAKFIAAFIPFVAPQDIAPFFFTLSLCLLAAVAVHRSARAIPAVRNLVPHWKSWHVGRRFPMGLGLAAGFSLFLAIRAFNLPFLQG